ncbi:MAG: hypothetical protein E7557_09325 [Ruminococcaceae bacterium]|nr:hypothetical protein [Oscillospiraceae bacterium]
MKKENVILTCYSLLRKETPLKLDCGKICGGKCCKGDSNLGMLLFPGEENLIDGSIEIKETENGDKIAVCNGTCDRNKRPLSCRIYPVFPLIVKESNKEKIKTVFDLRADCPLTNSEFEFNKTFLRKVKRVGKYLLLNEETKEFYLSLCDDFNEELALLKLLQKNL